MSVAPHGNDQGTRYRKAAPNVGNAAIISRESKYGTEERVARALAWPGGRTGVHPSMSQRLEMADAAISAVLEGLMPQEIVFWNGSTYAEWLDFIKFYEYAPAEIVEVLDRLTPHDTARP